ncbi:MAG: hypothetical protein KBS98_09175 [Flavobacterium sp.]|nr:hypothetical protein [Candidatus Neoflavobacterium equi]
MLVTKNIKISDILKGTYRNTFRIIVVSILTYVVNVFLLNDYLHFPALVPTVLGTALAFFIGFNNNQAYDRWWEARTIWGAIVNDSRSFTRMLTTQIPVNFGNETWVKVLIERMVKRHIAYLYALKDHLRAQDEKYYLNYIDPKEYLDHLEGSTNKHNALLQLQSKDLEILLKNNIIDGFKYMQINDMLTRFTDSMGRCERIKSTVFPTTYRYYCFLFTWIFIITATLVTSDIAGYWSIMYGSLLGHIFIIIQVLGQSLVDPFENIPTGIALNAICRTIERNLLEVLGEENLPESEPVVDGFYIM